MFIAIIVIPFPSWAAAHYPPQTKQSGKDNSKKHSGQGNYNTLKNVPVTQTFV